MQRVTVSLVWAFMGGLVGGGVGCSGDSPYQPMGGPDAGNPNGRLCGATLTTSGSFEPDASVGPNPGSGCWPYGTWTFTTAIVSNNCSPAPTAQQYKFKVSQMINQDGDPVQVFTYLTDPSARSIVKVTQGGAGLCEGDVELFSADGKTVYLLKPELGNGTALTGSGEYTVYTTDQWPF